MMRIERAHVPKGAPERGVFDFHHNQEVGWMQNIYPLDMIFIRGDGRILRIEKTPSRCRADDMSRDVRAILRHRRHVAQARYRAG
jgi:uncharacterized membrane protein (UPF0127 family)